MSAASETRDFLRSTQHGVLATHSARFEGYPFGSIAPFVLDDDGNPLILISSLAEHTKNIASDARVSLMAFDASAEDMQAGARLTMLGEARLLDKQEGPLRDRYLDRFPQAAQYFDMHDFQFYCIDIEHARYIGGFGKIHWLSGEALRSEA